MLRRTFATPMKAIVGVKRVIDYSIKIRVKDNAVVKDQVKMSMNPFDEIAVEEAIRLKEKGIIKEVTAVSIGSKKNEEVLRTALALGVDKAILITTPDDLADKLEPLAVAKIFAKLAKEIQPDLFILGKQAIDDDCCATAQLLAGILEIPQGTFASQITIDGKVAKVVREIDTGRQEIELTLPAVLAADLRLNTPRYVAIPNIMKARKKPIDIREADKLGVDLAPRLTVVSVVEPPTRAAGKKVKTVEELVSALQNDAKVLA
eukprot:PhF_6_TR29503/c0_g1_i1/m.43685/K03521/fixA, etfB; electron transfer flavoprotein beta subunit